MSSLKFIDLLVRPKIFKIKVSKSRSGTFQFLNELTALIFIHFRKHSIDEIYDSAIQWFLHHDVETLVGGVSSLGLTPQREVIHGCCAGVSI